MPDLNSLPKHWLAVAFDGRAHRHIVQEFNRMSQSRRLPASRSQDPRADALEATVAMPNLSALWQLPRTSVSLARLTSVYLRHYVAKPRVVLGFVLVLGFRKS